MPELPEVETVVRTLSAKVVGRTIHNVRLNRTDIVTPQGFDLARHLRGRNVVDITRRAKRIVVRLDNDDRFYIHLGMSGRLTIEKPDAPMLPHTHLVLDVGGSEIRFRDPRRFGGIWWLGKERDDENIGPEPLALRTPQLAKMLSKTKRAIKSALLDQRLIAGLGNIYADEALHAAGIHPKKRADKLNREQVRRLNVAIKSTLRRAIRHKGSTLRDYVDADGAAGNFHNLHRVYAREGEDCLRCKTPIKRIVLGGRSTCFCPQCQPRAAR